MKFNVDVMRTKRLRMLKRAIVRCGGSVFQTYNMNNYSCLMHCGVLNGKIIILKTEQKDWWTK